MMVAIMMSTLLVSASPSGTAALDPLGNGTKCTEGVLEIFESSSQGSDDSEEDQLRFREDTSGPASNYEPCLSIATPDCKVWVDTEGTVTNTVSGWNLIVWFKAKHTATVSEDVFTHIACEGTYQLTADYFGEVGPRVGRTAILQATGSQAGGGSNTAGGLSLALQAPVDDQACEYLGGVSRCHTVQSGLWSSEAVIDGRLKAWNGRLNACLLASFLNTSSAEELVKENNVDNPVLSNEALVGQQCETVDSGIRLG